MSISQFVQIINPILGFLISALVTWAGTLIIPIIVNILKNKYIKGVGKDIWNIIEEEFRLNPVIGDTIQAKIKLFESKIKIKIPWITDTEITFFNKAIAGEVNKDKAVVEKAIQEPTTKVVIVEPNTIYKTPEGSILASTVITPADDTQVTQ